MGLSGPKKRTKLSSDPNNTAWSKSTATFGHKILSAQGWKPGQLLGAENAAHAEHFTAANASHIKVMLREDNLGLGAKLGRDSAETFGLSTLSNIFGRLNGKSDEVLEKQQSAQRDAELRQYQTRKFGYMTFVSGGFLVGDNMEDGPEALAKLSTAKLGSDAKPSSQESKVLASAGDKKRKREEAAAANVEQAPSDLEESDVTSSDDSKSRKKRKKKHETKVDASTTKKSKKKSKHVTPEPTDADGNKSKRSKAASSEAADDAAAVSSTDKKLDKAARRAAKQARKEGRARRREERKKHKSSRSVSPDTTHDISSSTSVAAAPSTGSAFAGSRQAVRQRWIQQKRLASMDAQALNEILMLKTTTVT